MGIHTRIDAWNWVSTQIKENLKNRGWTHAKSLGDIAIGYWDLPISPLYHTGDGS